MRLTIVPHNKPQSEQARAHKLCQVPVKEWIKETDSVQIIAANAAAKKITQSY